MSNGSVLDLVQFALIVLLCYMIRLLDRRLESVKQRLDEIEDHPELSIPPLPNKIKPEIKPAGGSDEH